MSFAFPLAFIGLLAAPALTAIYWLRSRSRKRTVSSLMLWMDQRQLKEGGLLIDRLQTPLLLLLELLSILLLVLAAAGPMVRAGTGAAPLVVVLDDSFSMLAGGKSSPRHRGEESVRSEIRAGGYSAIRLVLAGTAPQILGEAAEGGSRMNALFDHWKCYSPSANLEEAITFAFALGGDRCRVLVVTDHAPAAEQIDERLEWRAFGRRDDNVGFVTATRTDRDGQDRCLLEIANLSDRQSQTDLVVEAANTGGFREIKRSRLNLSPNGTERIVLTLAHGAGEIRARLGDDALKIDNEVMLAPEREQGVRVELAMNNEALRDLVQKAFEAIPSAEMVSSAPDLVVTDEAASDVRPGSWILRFITDQPAESLIGPFVIDRNNQIAEGLSLDGVIWGAGKSPESTGALLIMAGNIPLLTATDRADGAREIRFSFRPEMSTLQRTPAWPVLMWNILNWRASEMPGVSPCNLKLGSDAKIKLAFGTTAVSVREPSGSSRELISADRIITFNADEPGVYEVTAGTARYSFAANAVRKEESDLRQTTSGNWGSLFALNGLEQEQRSITWIFILLLLIVLACHLALVSRDLSAGRSAALT